MKLYDHPLTKLWWKLTRGDWHHFFAIYCETHTVCNRGCHYCPVSTDRRAKAEITAGDWALFLRRLREYRWRGLVGLLRFNEPLLDKQIVKRVRQLKEQGCKPLLYSNGDLLTDALANELVEAGLFRCYLTNHPPEKPGWVERIRDIVAWYPKEFILKPAVIPEPIGGLNIGLHPYSDCTLPSWALCFDHALNGILCCHDYRGEHRFGNLRRASIGEVWNNPRFRAQRQQLRAGKPTLPICRDCFQFSEELRPVLPSSLEDTVPCGVS